MQLLYQAIANISYKFDNDQALDISKFEEHSGRNPPH
jgi:hypothetical protein